MPRAKATAASPAIVPARSTDGSALVSSTNQPITASVAARRTPGLARWTQRRRDGKGEGDVLSGDGRQMGQPALAEAGSHRLGLVGVVADDQSSGERGVVVAQRGGRRSDQRPNPVRRDVEATASNAVAEHVVIEAPTTCCQATRPARCGSSGLPSALDPHDVALSPGIDAKAGRPTTHPRLEALVVDPQDDASGAERRVRVAGDRRPSDVAAELIGDQFAVDDCGSDDDDQRHSGDPDTDPPPSCHGDRRRSEDEHLGRRTTPGTDRHDDGDEDGTAGSRRRTIVAVPSRVGDHPPLEFPAT